MPLQRAKIRPPSPHAYSWLPFLLTLLFGTLGYVTSDVSSSDSEGKTCSNSGDETCLPGAAPKEDDVMQQECGIWLAPSSLPGAGLGMYAGRDFAPREPMQPTGDVVIPMIDIQQQQFARTDFFFLWDEYVWGGAHLGMGHEGHVEVKVASPGFVSQKVSFQTICGR